MLVEYACGSNFSTKFTPEPQSVIIKDTEKVKRVSDEKSASVKCVDTVI